jgi:hypothetical protein
MRTVKETKNMLMSRLRNKGQSHNTKINNKYFETAANLKQVQHS